jgi:hypothetical protein
LSAFVSPSDILWSGLAVSGKEEEIDEDDDLRALKERDLS